MVLVRMAKWKRASHVLGPAGVIEECGELACFGVEMVSKNLPKIRWHGFSEKFI